ncbi:MAG: hypoxanthine-guanine phosphoribosyltransferase [Gammaproteobacteria bacterium]|nr:hypoxanthine-guanine phosphoribosyltransferase [Gammaproteobacteria bacterium]
MKLYFKECRAGKLIVDIKTIKQVEKESDCLADAAKLNDVLDKLAKNITADFKDKNPLVLCVMTGGIIPTGHLVTRLTFPLQLDYIHATRYRGETSGGELHWIQEPSISLKNRNIIIIDDIFDEGITLLEIAKYCETKGASSVKSVVLVNKLHDRKADYQPDYVGLDIEDRYLFGFGMDYKNYLRNINAIYAVKGM